MPRDPDDQNPGDRPPATREEYRRTPGPEGIDPLVGALSLIDQAYRRFGVGGARDAHRRHPHHGDDNVWVRRASGSPPSVDLRDGDSLRDPLRDAFHGAPTQHDPSPDGATPRGPTPMPHDDPRVPSPCVGCGRAHHGPCARGPITAHDLYTFFQGELRQYEQIAQLNLAFARTLLDYGARSIPNLRPQGPWGRATPPCEEAPKPPTPKGCDDCAKADDKAPEHACDDDDCEGCDDLAVHRRGAELVALVSREETSTRVGVRVHNPGDAPAAITVAASNFVDAHGAPVDVRVAFGNASDPLAPDASRALSVRVTAPWSASLPYTGHVYVTVGDELTVHPLVVTE